MPSASWAKGCAVATRSIGVGRRTPKNDQRSFTRYTTGHSAFVLGPDVFESMLALRIMLKAGTNKMKLYVYALRLQQLSVIIARMQVFLAHCAHMGLLLAARPSCA